MMLLLIANNFRAHRKENRMSEYKEIKAIGVIIEALAPLDGDARKRAINYAVQYFNDRDAGMLRNEGQRA